MSQCRECTCGSGPIPRLLTLPPRTWMWFGGRRYGRWSFQLLGGGVREGRGEGLICGYEFQLLRLDYITVDMNVTVLTCL